MAPRAARPRTPWYISLFRGDYQRYYLGARSGMIAPARSDQEVKLIIERLGLRPGDRVVDFCCGTGRHAIRLAQAGMRVTGIDLSAPHLREARQDATAAGVTVRWVRSDVRAVPRQLSGQFDAAINMFTSLGYFDSEAEDLRAVRSIAACLRPGGLLLCETMNRDWLIRNYTPRDWLRHNGATLLFERRFDASTGTNHEEFTIIEPGGRTRRHVSTLRLYSLLEFKQLLRRGGLTFRAALGDAAGAHYGFDSPRMIVIAQRNPRTKHRGARH